MTVTTTLLYWTAGFLDGEGTFARSSSLRVSASQVQLWPLEKLQSLFGGSVTKNGPPGPNQKQCYAWYIHGHKAAALMMTLYMLMSPRRQEQIEKALALWKTEAITQSLRTACPKGHPYRKNRRGRYCPICTEECRRKGKLVRNAKTLVLVFEPAYGLEMGGGQWS